MDKQLQIDFFNSIADQWDTLYPQNSAKLACLVELCDLRPGARILDVACGTGQLTSFLLEKNISGLLSVDFAPRMIDAAKAKCSSELVEFRCCDIMEVADSGFDCAIICGGFQYFENRGSLIRQMHHLLASGGRLMICNPYSRTEVNSCHQANAIHLAMPLSTAQTLAASLEPYFDVDMRIDSNAIYVVSGTRRFI